MAILFYGSMFFISVIYLIILLNVYKKHISAPYIMLSASIIIGCLAHLQIGMSDTVEAAVIANQLSYLSSIFSVFFMMKCIMQICKFKVPFAVNFYCVTIGMFFFACSLSIGNNDVFYKSVDIGRKFGATYLIKEYAFLHTFYPIYIFSILIFCIVAIVITLKKRKDVSKRSSWRSLALMIISALVYVLERVFKSPIEFMPLAYIVGFAIILVQLDRVRMYNLEGFTTDAIEKSHEFGFILFDYYGRFEAADDFSKECFPELNDLEVDCYCKTEGSELLTQIQKWIKGSTVEEAGSYTCGNRVIEARYTEITQNNNRTLHCVRLIDVTKQHQYNALISDYNSKLEKDVNEKTQKFIRVQDDIIISMASIVENRDNNTGGHIQRSSAVVKIFVEHLMEVNYLKDLTPEIAGMIIKAAPLHDFGKIAIPDSILNKPGKFEAWEYDKMKEHSAKGAVIVARILQHSEDIAFRNIAVNIAHYHHEKWDGKGYPEGLTEKEIPFEARVMALADVFDALVSKRVYKDSFDYDKAFKIIEESGGSHFDPDLCRIFLECRPSLEALYNSFDD